jgi:hypothetical protein
MTDREAELRRLATTLREHDAVADAFIAKSFTDRLLIVDIQRGDSIPRRLVESISDHDLVGANVSFAGAVGDETRHQFVDVRTRGDHQSYVVE